MSFLSKPIRWISSAANIPRNLIHGAIRRRQDNLVDAMRSVGSVSPERDIDDGGFSQNESLTPLDRLTKLQRLRLLRMELTYAGLESLKVIDPVNLFEVARDKVAPAAAEHIKGLIETGSEELNRIRTEFTDTGLQYLRDLTSLKRLWLSGTELEDAATETQDMAYAIESLRLGNVAVQDEELQHLGDLAELEVLILNDLDLGDDGLVNLAKLDSIQTLDLSGNQRISDQGIVHIAGRTTLQFLSLDNTSIGDEALAMLAEMTNMKCLYLAETNITDEGLQFLQRLTNLESLGLPGTRISDAGVEWLLRIEQLRRLDLSGTQISDTAISSIRQLRALKSISLDHTSVSNAAIESLVTLPELDCLSVVDANVSADAIGVQRDLHPTIEILS